MRDALSRQYADLLMGCYDCVDRIVLNAYNVLCYNAGGFRCWWRRLYGSDADLDEAHLKPRHWATHLGHDFGKRSAVCTSMLGA
jgi:hypothetical protein